MIEVNTKNAINSLRREFSSLTNQDVNKAVVRSINRSLVRGRTETSKSLRQIYSIKATDIKNRVSLERASVNNQTGTISASTNRLPLSLFKPSQKRRGASVRIKKKREIIPSSFLATTRGGFKGVFKRGQYTGRGAFEDGKARLPITSLVTLSLRTAMANNRVSNDVAAQLGRYFPERLRHELSYIASKNK